MVRIMKFMVLETLLFKGSKMKKYVMILMLMFLVSATYAVEVDTPQNTAMLITAVEANDTALDVNTTSWAYAKNWTAIPQTWSNLKVMFFATEPNATGVNQDPDACTFKYKIYIADYGNSGQLIVDGNAVVGKMHLSHNPVSLVELNGGAISTEYCWVDTLDVTDDWNGTTAGQNDAGADDAASIIIGRESGKTIECIITARSTDDLHVWCIAYGY